MSFLFIPYLLADLKELYSVNATLPKTSLFLLTCMAVDVLGLVALVAVLVWKRLLAATSDLQRALAFAALGLHCILGCFSSYYLASGDEVGGAGAEDASSFVFQLRPRAYTLVTLLINLYMWALFLDTPLREAGRSGLPFSIRLPRKFFRENWTGSLLVILTLVLPTWIIVNEAFRVPVGEDHRTQVVAVINAVLVAVAMVGLHEFMSLGSNAYNTYTRCYVPSAFAVSLPLLYVCAVKETQRFNTPMFPNVAFLGWFTHWHFVGIHCIVGMLAAASLISSQGSFLGKLYRPYIAAECVKPEETECGINDSDIGIE